MVVGSLKPRDLPSFKWVNTVLGNLKTVRADPNLSHRADPILSQGW